MPIGRQLKRSFVAGLLILAPLLVTIVIFQFAAGWVLGFIDPLVQNSGILQFTDDDRLVAQVLTIGLILVVIVAVGAIAQFSVGRHLFGNVGRVVNVIPLVSTVYGGVRQVANSLVERESSFEEVVLVEAPRANHYTIGFVTGDGPADAERVADEPVSNVYLPSSPNPTQGRLMLVPESELHETEMSVRRGMRLLLTTGMGEEDVPVELPGLPPEERGLPEGDSADGPVQS